MSVKIIMVAAHGKNREIGRGNKLPWRIPAEMQHFKRYTLGRTILMGRKTAESLGSALKQRNNLVLTHGDTAPYPDMIPVSTLQEAVEFTRSRGGSELVIIGGEEVYRQFIEQADKLIISYVSIEIPDADAFFPEIPEDLFEMTSAVPHLSDTPSIPDFSVWTFERFVPLARG